MPIKRFGPVVLSLAVLLMGATPASAHEDPTTTVVGEVRHLAVEHLDGSSLDLTLVVPEDGEAVRVRGEGIEAVASGAVVEVEVEDLRDDPFQATDPSAGATVTDVAVVADGAGCRRGAVAGQRARRRGDRSPGSRGAHGHHRHAGGGRRDARDDRRRGDGAGGAVLVRLDRRSDRLPRRGSQLDAGAFTGASVSGGCSDTFIHEVLDWRTPSRPG